MVAYLSFYNNAVIFPIGAVQQYSSDGLIDSISYSMFEPNLRASSMMAHNILTTRFLDQTIQSRKKSESYLTIMYEYENIWAREYRQIEHFCSSVDDALTSFFIPDFSKIQTPASVVEDGSNWKVFVDDTHLFSITESFKSHYVFLWDGTSWKAGPIQSISTNTSITFQPYSYGSLTVSEANSNGKLYPFYEVYFSPNALANFKPSKSNWYDNASVSGDGGPMYSGSIQFVTKYKV